MVTKRVRGVLTISSFASMFVLGVGATIVGGAARNIGLSAFQIGLLIAVQNIGFMSTIVVTGVLADVYEKPKILFVGCLVLALSLFAFYRWESFTVNLIIMFFIGAGLGTYEGVTDAMLVEIHGERRNLYININHFFVTFGSLMITLYLIFLQGFWRNSVIQVSIAVAVMGFLYLLTRLEVAGQRGDTELLNRLGYLLRQRRIRVLFAAMICTVGLELGCISILTTFFMELRSFTQVTSKIGLIVFLAGTAGGRIVVGFAAPEKRIYDVLIILFALAAVFTGTLFFIPPGVLPSNVLLYILTAAAGASTSALLPTIIAVGGIMYREMSGTVMGVIKLAIPVGGIILPVLLSLLSRSLGFASSLVLFPVAGTLGFLILLFSRSHFRPAPSGTADTVEGGRD